MAGRLWEGRSAARRCWEEFSHGNTRKYTEQEHKERSTNNLDKTIYSLAERGTTKHAKSAKMKTGKILFKEQSYRMIGACFEVYKEKGEGFLEAVFCIPYNSL